MSCWSNVACNSFSLSLRDVVSSSVSKPLRNASTSSCLCSSLSFSSCNNLCSSTVFASASRIFSLRFFNLSWYSCSSFNFSSFCFFWSSSSLSLFFLFSFCSLIIYPSLVFFKFLNWFSVSFIVSSASLATSFGSNIKPARPPLKPSSKLVAISPTPGNKLAALVIESIVPKINVRGRLKNLIIPCVIFLFLSAASIWDFLISCWASNWASSANIVSLVCSIFRSRISFSVLPCNLSVFSLAFVMSSCVWARATLCSATFKDSFCSFVTPETKPLISSQ